MASLGGMAFWEQTSDTEFKPHLLQMDGICTSLGFNSTSRHCLASFRPNKNHTRTRHVVNSCLFVFLGFKYRFSDFLFLLVKK